MKRREDEAVMWESDSRESMVSVSMGRALNTLLGARSRKLHDSTSRLSPNSDKSPSSLGSLEDLIWFLHKYVKDAAERKFNLDELLVPLIQHWLRNRDMKHGGQAVILLNWLFLDESLFQFVASNLANIIMRRDDRYIALGWCVLTRSLMEYESFMDQYTLNGIKDNYNALRKIFCSCVPHLSRIICEGSNLQDGYELPSRLSLSAADCMIAVSEALTKKTKVPSRKPKLSSLTGAKGALTLVPAATRDKKQTPARQASETVDIDMAYLLWNQIDELITLLKKLCAWSMKSRPLHATGVEQVLKWVQELRGQYGCHSDEAGADIVRQRSLLLSSCWKNYSILLHLEDQKFSKHCNELLEQYIAGIQHYTDNDAGECKDNNESAVETRKFFLNCLCLLLGRFDSKKFETVVSEYRIQISQALLSQLHSVDEDVVAVAACIFKATILKPSYSSGTGLVDSGQMDAVLPLLLHLLDERDGTSRAVVLLIAEYCSTSTESQCIQQVLDRLASGNVHKRRNAIDVISELVCMIQDSVNTCSPMAWQDVVNKLVDCLSDQEKIIREQASKLLSKTDPSSVLPAIVPLVCSSDELVQTSAGSALIGMLNYHKHDPKVICMLVDCLSNLSQSADDRREGSGLNSDRVYKLVSEWSKSVQDWNSLIATLVDKMFSEPTNATIVRFFSCISEHLVEATDTIMYLVLSQMKGQKEVDAKYTKEDTVEMQQHLFERLSPLLLIRLLPLSIFNDLNSSTMYGQLPNQVSKSEDIKIIDQDSVAGFLVKRAFNASEFEDVRKLAAELCGRILPKVLFPVVSSSLEHAAVVHDIPKIKACLFSVCTSLVVRGRDSLSYPSFVNIIKILEKILLWPSLDGDEVFKAQHGCIDCLALMICAELQALGSFTDTSEKFRSVAEGTDFGATSENSVLTYVIRRLIDDKKQIASTSFVGNQNCSCEMPAPKTFRLCMANVLVSVCQKMRDSGRKAFAQKTLPCLMCSLEMITYPEIRAACIQVLFSAVYHLKSAVTLYSSDLLKLSMESLKKGSEKERMAGAKLMVSLMASEDLVLKMISGGLLEARSVLSSISSSSEASYELKQVCKQLLSCIASP